MLSPEEREELGELISEIRKLNWAAHTYAPFLKSLTGSLFGNRHTQDKPASFTDSEIELLMTLNLHLRSIESLIRKTAHEYSPDLIGKIKDPNDPMGDFEIGVEIDFVLRDDDPEASEDSDNILTTRNVFSASSFDDDTDADDYRESCDSQTEQLAAEPHCYLFHDLYDHSYGLEQPRVPLRDCLRIGKVWVDVVTRQQYCLDLDTGKWEKHWGERKLATLRSGDPT